MAQWKPKPPRPDHPNPGSADARVKGCACPVIENNYGELAPWPPNGWSITDGCPLHAPPDERTTWRLQNPRDDGRK